MGLIAYRLKTKSSLYTVGGNGSFSASVKFAPLANIAVTAHSNSISISVVTFIVSGLKVGSVDRVVCALGGRSKLTKVSKISSSVHSVLSMSRTGRHTHLTVSVFIGSVIGCVKRCCFRVNKVSKVIFATKVNRGSTIVQGVVVRELNFVGVAVSGRGGRRRSNTAIVSNRSSTVAVVGVPAGRRLVVTHSMVRLGGGGGGY